jgi:hypothetical protein
MDATFRLARQKCSGNIDVEIRLSATGADRFHVVFSPLLAKLAPWRARAIALGIAEAFQNASDALPLCVEITDVVVHCPETAEIGYAMCGQAAMNRLLGHDDKNPSPGFPLSNYMFKRTTERDFDAS